MKRFVSWMLCISMLAVLASCRHEPAKLPEDSADGQITTDAPGGNDPVQPAVSAVAVADLSRYVIVYPENANEELISAATSLASAIAAKFGVNLKVKNDFYSDFMASMAISEYEILLGATNRGESAKVLQSLNYLDRGYQMVDKKIVIAAHDDYSAALAVSDFNLNVVLNAKSDAEYFYTSEKDAFKTGSYRFGIMNLNGRKISDYRIVYSRNGEALEARLAEKVKTLIAENCGAVLTVADDSVAADGTPEILIGKTNRSATLSALNGVNNGQGYMALENGNLILCGNSALGNTAAADAFLNTFTAREAAESIDLQIENGLYSSVRENDVMSAMTFNVLVGSVTNDRVDRVIDTIVRYLPDTVGLQECSVQWRNYILRELGDYYEYVGVGREAGNNGEATPVLYAKEKFNLVDSGTKWLTNTPDEPSKLPGAGFLRVYTWATLERKSDGLRFMHLNTHLDTASSDVRQTEAAMLVEFLYEHRDLAIIMTGDFNCYAESPEFAMLVGEFMRNAAWIAENQDMGSFTVNNVIDFLLAYDLYIDVRYYKIAYERVNGAYASDHRAGYMEYIIDYNGTPVMENPTTQGGHLVVVPDREGSEYSDPTIVF